MNVRVIFFDLDDTLFPAEDIYYRGLRAAWQSLKSVRPISWKQFLITYAKGRGAVKARLGKVPAARNRILYFKEMVEVLWGHSNPEISLELMRAYNSCWRYIHSGSARKIAQQLSGQYKLGVLTNQVAGFQLEKMKRIDPSGRWFKILVTSEEVGCEKPAQRFFIEACRRAKCRPMEAIVVGNSWNDDILGAHRAGLQAIYLSPNADSRKLPRGVAQTRSLTGVQSAIKALSER
jgi:putative hydrolase of the HAD superfamily